MQANSTSNLWRQALVTCGCLLLAKLAQWVPLPGLDTKVLLTALAELTTPQATLSDTPIARFSIVALGTVPFVSAWILTAPFRRAMPPESLWRFTMAAGIAFAAVQAYAVAVAFEQSRFLASPGLDASLLQRVAIIATLMSGPCLLVWLGSVISRHGLGDGFWLIAAVSVMGSLVSSLTWVGESARSGALSSSRIALVFVGLAGLFSLLTALELARHNNASAQSPSHNNWTSRGPHALIPIMVATFVLRLVFGRRQDPIAEIATLLLLTGVIAALYDGAVNGFKNRGAKMALFAASLTAITLCLTVVDLGIQNNPSASSVNAWAIGLLVVAYAAQSIIVPLVLNHRRNTAKKIDLTAAKVR